MSNNVIKIQAKQPSWYPYFCGIKIQAKTAMLVSVFLTFDNKTTTDMQSVNPKHIVAQRKFQGGMVLFLIIPSELDIKQLTNINQLG